MNIKKIIKSVLLFLLLAIFLFEFIAWASLDFSFYFIEIDSCLDKGSAWDYTKNQCLDSKTTVYDFNIYILKYLFFIGSFLVIILFIKKIIDFIKNKFIKHGI